MTSAPVAPPSSQSSGDRLAGEVALVTGAASGIGRATAELFARHGAAVGVSDVDLAAARTVADGIVAAGGHAIPIRLDVTSSREAEAAASTVTDTFGKVDILVNCAGGARRFLGEYRLFVDSREEDWDTIIGINLKGPLVCTKAVISQMIDRRHGRILNLGSVAGVCGLRGMVDYSGAKAGVAGLTRALAMEVAPYEVTVNCVSPGMINPTAAGPNVGTYLGRSGRPYEVASLLLHLASPDGAFITGENIVIDGGRVLGPKLGEVQ